MFIVDNVSIGTVCGDIIGKSRRDPAGPEHVLEIYSLIRLVA